MRDNIPSPVTPPPQRSALPWFLVASAALCAGLIFYSQTYAFAWDEGFHLLAAQLIKNGHRPYLDFAFAQTPLNAYFNAICLRILGDGWRQIQLVDALLTTAAIMLAAGFLRPRFHGWGTPTLIAVLYFAGANLETVKNGTIGQAYALGLLLIVASFRLAVACLEQGPLERDRPLAAALSGLLAGAAAGSTLLTAPVAPVLLLWIFLLSPSGKKLSRAALFLTGAGVSWIPLIALFAQSPARVIFDVFRYHIFFRRSDWPGATQHDLEIFASWIDNPQVILLVSLALAGLWFVARKSGWDHLRRQQFYLCGYLAAALALHVSTAHPTFPMYYIFTSPFLGILAAVGLCSVSTQLGLRRALRPTLAVGLLTCLGLAKSLYEENDKDTWPKLQAVARQVDAVTPAGATLYADEPTYFLTRRTPPPGNEYISSHKLRLPADLAELVHITPQPEFDRRIAAGTYDTLETCDGEDWINNRKLGEIYAQKAQVGDCTVFWERRLQK